MSLVYLLHFMEPFKHAKHYLGFAEAGLKKRLARHRSGAGAKLVRAVMKSGGDFVLARTWKGEGVDRHFERRLKNRKNACKLCPICRRSRKKEEVS